VEALAIRDAMASKTDSKNIQGSAIPADPRDFGSEVDFSDHVISFVTGYCRGKDVLDIGCVNHDPANYQSRYWVHGALKKVARSLIGIDLYEAGVAVLIE
jgi:hypothetical protein